MSTTHHLQRGALRLTATLDNGALTETWALRAGPGDWETILTYTGPTIMSDPAVAVTWQSLERHGARIVATGQAGGMQIQRVVQLTYLRGLVSHTVSAASPFELTGYEDVYTLATNQPDWVWSQTLKQYANDFVPHWMFKCPAVIYQSAGRVAAILPDLEPLDAATLQRQPTALDLHNDGAAPTTFSYGVAPNKLDWVNVYGRDAEHPIAWDGTPLTIDHQLLFDTDQPAHQGFRRVVADLWKRQGWPHLRDHPEAQQNYFFTQYNTFVSWSAYTWTDFAQTYYRQFDDPGETTATFMTQRNVWANHVGTDTDCWFNAWFQTLRTALGIWLYGDRTGQDVYKQQGRYVLNLAISAPRDQGCFPSIFWRGDDGSNNWVKDSGWAGFQDSYHMFDMTWTCFWMLRWLERAAPDEGRIIPQCKALADFLIAQRRPNGCIPSWYLPDLTPRPELRDDNAETGSAALFFADLHHATGEQAYLDAARSAMAYIRDSVFPAQRWYDFEAFLASSPKPFDFTDPLTRQIPHNNLCQIVTAMAAVRLFEVGGDNDDLEFARVMADYLSLTQIVFPHPLLSIDTIAGFTVQNSDGEWSDARQAYSSDLFFRLYRHTGDEALLQRAVGAMRASSPPAPFENWAHNGSEDIFGTFTGLHWGLGSMMTSVEFHLDRYRQAYIHVGRRQGVGVDGCTLSGLIVLPVLVRFNLTSPFPWPTPPVVVIDGAHLPMAVFANGQPLGIFTPEQLRAGIPVPLAGDQPSMAKLIQQSSKTAQASQQKK